VCLWPAVMRVQVYVASKGSLHSFLLKIVERAEQHQNRAPVSSEQFMKDWKHLTCEKRCDR
jgi:hypothetical protein